MELREPVVVMTREKCKRQKLKHESIDARHWGGAVCSSDEVSVMEMERRYCIKLSTILLNCDYAGGNNSFVTKPFDIPKQRVWEAYQLVKANKGAAGVDQQTLENFEAHLKDNLYKIWNRLASGSYFPPPVKAVKIPKKTGGERVLGVPTVEDRIAQMVIKLSFEPKVESHFLTDSYGYRPNKSALDAVEITRKRCWKYDWVLEFDIKGLFDNISHELLMKAVRKHTDSSMEILYIERWLKAPMQLPEGTLIKREKGTPQGGVVSPVLSNLFLHYAFDTWMQKYYPATPWCRYADDGLIHCKTEKQAQQILTELAQRFREVGLEIHPDKTKIIYCKDRQRKGKYQSITFDFLGYTFRPRLVRNGQTQGIFASFSPAASKLAVKEMRAEIKRYYWKNRTEISLEDIANVMNPIIQGWINYYGKYHRTKLNEVWRYLNKTLVSWARKKFKSLKGSKAKATMLMIKIAGDNSRLFSHWRIGMISAFA